MNALELIAALLMAAFIFLMFGFALLDVVESLELRRISRRRSPQAAGFPAVCNEIAARQFLRECGVLFCDYCTTSTRGIFCVECDETTHCEYCGTSVSENCDKLVTRM